MFASAEEHFELKTWMKSIPANVVPGKKGIPILFTLKSENLENNFSVNED